MIRPGKLVKPLKEERVRGQINPKFVPFSRRDAIRRFIHSAGRKVTLNDIYKATNGNTSRRLYERVLLDMVNTKVLHREPCQCGCSYLYELYKRK